MSEERMHLKINDLFPNPFQPPTRVNVSESIAEKFGKSILEHGLYHLPLVRVVDKGEGRTRFEVADGWLRRAGFAWLTRNDHPEYATIPVILRGFTDQQMADMVVETKEVDIPLNPIEKAWTLQKYFDTFPNVTQTEFARRHGKTQGEISNTVRLLDLPLPVQEMIILQKISESHGRTLLQLKESQPIIDYARLAVKNSWSVALLDGYIKFHAVEPPAPAEVAAAPPEAPDEKPSSDGEKEVPAEAVGKGVKPCVACSEWKTCGGAPLTEDGEGDYSCPQFKPEKKTAESEEPPSSSHAPTLKLAAIPVTAEFMKIINASYSGDRIPEGKIREPFHFLGKKYISVRGFSKGEEYQEEECYQVVERKDFHGLERTYKLPPGRGHEEYYESLRQDPNGFYHGMVVAFRGKEYVLNGPELKFYSGETAASAEKPAPVKEGAPSTLVLRQLLIKEKSGHVEFSIKFDGGQPILQNFSGRLEDVFDEIPKFVERASRSPKK